MIDVAKNSDYKDVEAVKTAIAAAESERDAVIDKNNVNAVKAAQNAEYTLSFTIPGGAVSVNVSVPEKTQHTIAVTSDNEYTVMVDGKPYSETADEVAGTTVKSR